MATPVQTYPQSSLERKAYEAVQDIPTAEENDRNRLGYHVFLHLNGQIPTVAEAVHLAQPRMPISNAEAVRMITANLPLLETGNAE